MCEKNLDFITTLRKNILDSNLPGRNSFDRMRPRPQDKTSMKSPDDCNQYAKAAVLIALFKENGSWHFPLIKRTEDGLPHGGQIALPGGRIKHGETAENAAIREAQEETGINPEKVQILGRLTPLPIPISKFLVHPIVGVLNRRPEFKPCPMEVSCIFTVSMGELSDKTKQKLTTRHHRGCQHLIPYFDFHGKEVWGATAMILSEFLDVANS